MGTWIASLVETKGRADVGAILAGHGIDVVGDTAAPWILVQSEISLFSLRPQAFAKALSNELGGCVISFLLQSTASVEELEHWENGRLLRKLEHDEERGWIAVGTGPVFWERAYFFTDDQSTADDAKWPDNLDDDVSSADQARYESARATGDPSPIFDLLRGGSLGPMHDLCKTLGIDPRVPAGIVRPPDQARDRLVLRLLGVFCVLVAVFAIVGVLRSRRVGEAGARGADVAGGTGR